MCVVSKTRLEVAADEVGGTDIEKKVKKATSLENWPATNTRKENYIHTHTDIHTDTDKSKYTHDQHRKYHTSQKHMGTRGHPPGKEK